MDIDLSSHVALVTGAAHGIGKTIALALAGAGADVAVNDISDGVNALADEIIGMGRKSVAAVFNIADKEAVNRGTDQVWKELGRIDILVNNAGITDNRAPVAKMTGAKWDWEMGVNLVGAFNCTASVLPGMAASGWGRIVMISSLGALGIHRQACYAASKAGLSGLARTVALEHSRDGITCNLIMCGLIGTSKVNNLPAEVLRLRTNMIPVGRIGKPEEVAALTVFLSSQQAAYITGEEICLDGGAHIPAVSYGARDLGYTP
ncbi:MAG: SDR family oxidoreductase [Dehalococcoidia bacterium]|nr:SDR family oxidoreductase [Dehalococcoidia bacterium]